MILSTEKSQILLKKKSVSPLFSILIANFNNGSFFIDCYKSIVSQTYRNFEVIIVDDFSTDNSVDLIKATIGNDSRFKLYFNEQNLGCGFTKNKCVKLATGEICGFLDPDDTLEIDAINSHVNIHLLNKSASLVYSNFNYCDENLNFISTKTTAQIENRMLNFFNQNGEISHFSSFKIIFYNKTEGIYPYLKRAVDQDLYLKLYDVGPAVHIDSVLYNYRIHQGGISTNENSKKALFWHWVVMIERAKKREINIEDLFVETLEPTNISRELRKDLEYFRNNLLFKVLRKIGIVKLYNFIIKPVQQT